MGLEPSYYPLLLSGGTGQTSKTPDQRITDVTTLPAGPFQLTNGSTFTYDSYAASPVHRFYQMWQQMNCNLGAAKRDNPSGCTSNLFAWVEVTVGAGTNGIKQPTNFSTEYSPSATTTGEGSTALGFYNVQKGDVPYFTGLVEKYALSDNFHQSVSGGTGANHIMFGHADAIWFSDSFGNPAVPPNGVQVFSGTPDAGTVNEVENPSPRPAPTTGIQKTGMASAITLGTLRHIRRRRSPAEVHTAIVRMPRSLASKQSSAICRHYLVRSIQDANPATIICSTTIIRAGLVMAKMRTSTPTPRIRRSRSRHLQHQASATLSMPGIFPGSTMAINGTTT